MVTLHHSNDIHMKNIRDKMNLLCPISEDTIHAGGIVFSMDELYYGKESEEFVETLEETDVYRISIEDLNHLLNSNMELCNWGRIIHQNEYRRIHQSHKERLTLPVLERYQEFEKQFPEISSTINLGHIASYLGTTLPTLSRVRTIIAKTQL